MIGLLRKLNAIQKLRHLTQVELEYLVFRKETQLLDFLSQNKMPSYLLQKHAYNLISNV